MMPTPASDADQDDDTAVLPAVGGSMEARVGALEVRIRQLQSVVNALLELRARERSLDEDTLRHRQEAQSEILGRIKQR